MARVIFLAGLGRSGTTLLERALAELPGVQALGEVSHLWRRSLLEDEPCGCGEAFSRCPYWQAVGERAFGGWDTVDVAAVEDAQSQAMRLRRIAGLTRGRRSVISAAELIADHHRRIYDAASAVAGASVVVDSSKHPALAYVLGRTPPSTSEWFTCSETVAALRTRGRSRSSVPKDSGERVGALDDALQPDRLGPALARRTIPPPRCCDLSARRSCSSATNRSYGSPSGGCRALRSSRIST